MKFLTNPDDLSIEEDLGNETNEVESDNVENNVVLCSQCSQPFASEAQCSQHMALAHNPHQPKTLVNSHETHHQTTAKRKRTSGGQNVSGRY